MINIHDLYEKIINLSGQYQIYNCSPSVLETSYNTFLSAVDQAVSIYNDYRPQISDVKIVTQGWRQQFSSKENSTDFTNYIFSDNPPDSIQSVFPSNVSGLTPPYLYDAWRFNTEKLPFIWRYEKPILYLMYPGRFNVSAIYYHKIMKHLKSLDLTSTMIGQKIDIYNNDVADVVAQKIAYWINRDLSGIFTASAIGSGKVRITNIALGAVTSAPTSGNTGFASPIVIQPGSVTLPEVTEITCTPASVNIQSKYFTISSPTDTYYFWFSLDEADGDPIVDNYFLYYIKNDYEDRIFFDLCNAKFMQLLGRSRSNFSLNGLDITNTGANMLTDGIALEDRVLEELKTNKNKFYIGWK
jgi:hypothetical protein